MSKVSNNYPLSEIVTVSVLKKKFKQYLSDAQRNGFKSSVFPKYLIVSLVMVLEEILSDCLEYVKKHETTGLYVVDYSMVQMVLNKNNKYDFSLKYLKKYNSTFKYQDSVFFSYRKVVDNLESKYGDKLMIEPDAKNFIAHVISSLQYDLIEMSLMMVGYANRKTMSAESLLCSYGILFKEMHSKIKLKLDSLITTKADPDADEDEETDGAEETEETPDSEEKGKKKSEHADKVDLTDEANKENETDEADEVDEASEDEPADVGKSGKSSKTEKTSKAVDKADKVDKTGKAGKTGKTGKTEEKDEVEVEDEDNEDTQEVEVAKPKNKAKATTGSSSNSGSGSVNVQTQKVSKKNVEIVDEDDMEKDLEKELDGKNNDVQPTKKTNKVVKK
jgi:hypothetical protein